MNIFFICFLITLTSFFVSYIYQSFASKKKILASINFRTLHAKETPKGGGIVLSSVFMISISIMIYLEILKDDVLLLVSLCSVLSSFVGFLDDLYDLKAAIKIVVQLAMAISILILIFPIYYLNSLYLLSALLLLCIFIVWVINSVNFMDGIDGLCSSIAICILTSASFGLHLSGYGFHYYLPFLITLSICIGFLIVNLSSKKLFMGDSGSLFLGYLLCFFALRSIMEGHLSFWFWSILFSFILTETTSTTIYRLFNLDNWHGAHRSHAYQNLARVLDNHKAVTGGVVAYHFFWLAPLSIASIVFSYFSLIYLILAILPVLVFNLKYGPRFSNS